MEDKKIKIKDKNMEDSEKLSRDKQNKYIKYFVLIMAIILLIIVAFAFKPKEAKFEYLGMEFERVMFDKIPLYQTVVQPINRITGEASGINYVIYLRNDPRKLEFVPIIGRIKLTRDVIVALDKSITEANCVNATLAALNMGQFMNAAGIKALRGTTNLTEAEEDNLRYASCESSDNISVIITEIGNKTEVVQEDVNCYKIKVNNCQVIEATERFLVGALAHSRGNFIG